MFNLEVQVASAVAQEELTYSAPNEEGDQEVVHEEREVKKPDTDGHAPGSSFFKR
jgi:hypothetical protein